MTRHRDPAVIEADLVAVDREIRDLGFSGVQRLLDRMRELRTELRRARFSFRSHGITHRLIIRPDEDEWVISLDGWATGDLIVRISEHEAGVLRECLGDSRPFASAALHLDEPKFVLEPEGAGWGITVNTRTGWRTAFITDGEAEELAEAISDWFEARGA